MVSLRSAHSTFSSLEQELLAPECADDCSRGVDILGNAWTGGSTIVLLKFLRNFSQHISEVDVLEISLVVHTQAHTIQLFLQPIKPTKSAITSLILHDHVYSQENGGEESRTEKHQDSSDREHILRCILASE